MNAIQRGQRRHDLLVASTLLRREIDANLTNLEPAAERVLHWVAIGQRLRRHRAGTRRVAVLLAAAGGALGGTRIGRAALRHLGWLSNVWIAWQLWKQWQR
jgi:hypothetical protein